MKKTILFAAAIFFLSPFLTALDLNSIQPSGPVSDYAGVISDADEQKISGIITELKQKTGAEIAVVTVKSLEGEDLNDITNTIFNKWGVGQKGNDNGVMLFVAVDDRKVRIETGYGIEGIIPDGAAGDIIRQIIRPAFIRGDYGGGIGGAVQTIAEKIGADKGVKITGEYETPGEDNYEQAKPNVLNILMMVVFLAIFIPVVIRNPWLLFFLLFSGRGGYRGGGGFGGGFGGGGFGGGSSGGGGASGGW